MGWYTGKRKQTGNREEFKDMNGRCRPSLRKLGRQVVENADWRGLGEETSRMLSALEAIVEKFDPEKVA